jgi:hypothetical protein
MGHGLSTNYNVSAQSPHKSLFSSCPRHENATFETSRMKPLFRILVTQNSFRSALCLTSSFHATLGRIPPISLPSAHPKASNVTRLQQALSSLMPVGHSFFIHLNYLSPHHTNHINNARSSLNRSANAKPGWSLATVFLGPSPP